MAENKNQRNPQENSGRSSNRGFASMDPQRQREIASEGGRAAHQQGVAHEWTSEEAREAGRKGGQSSRGGGRSQRGSQQQNERSSENESSQ
ncbi:KGG domain-containing protein [Paraflavisolibacter sp. H34]|uniref:KGG domain-containing protein n=1 Tax=Huijunlia imazamoxiresistens TaxID=3127457 RepID=UPI003018FFF9